MTKPQAPLPGAVGVTDVRVYDSPAPDGLEGGGAHVHLCCTEAYCVIEGAGSVQTLGPDGVLRDIVLEPQKIVWFTPGVIHRLINSDGKLRILVIMQNSGLPEAGDFVLTFPRAILSEPKQYERHASLAATGHMYASSEDAARKRRDLAVEGFHELRCDLEKRGTDAMRDFYRLAVALVKPKLNHWRTVWYMGAMEAANRTGLQLSHLDAGSIEQLMQGDVFALRPPAEDRKLGLCGTLGVFLPEGIAR
jgi:mannose-6-phosphate isomerase-like protein (cupin superfamily)